MFYQNDPYRMYQNFGNFNGKISMWIRPDEKLQKYNYLPTFVEIVTKGQRNKEKEKRKKEKGKREKEKGKGKRRKEKEKGKREKEKGRRKKEKLLQSVEIPHPLIISNF